MDQGELVPFTTEKISSQRRGLQRLITEVCGKEQMRHVVRVYWLDRTSSNLPGWSRSFLDNGQVSAGHICQAFKRIPLAGYDNRHVKPMR